MYVLNTAHVCSQPNHQNKILAFQLTMNMIECVCFSVGHYQFNNDVLWCDAVVNICLDLDTKTTWLVLEKDQGLG